MITEEYEPDTIQGLCGATIQHGHYNDRIYVMDTGNADPAALIPAIKTLADDQNYSKIFAKVPEDLCGAFEEAGFKREASVPGFFNGVTEAVFLGYYRDVSRQIELDAQEQADVMECAQEIQEHLEPSPLLSEQVTMRVCREKDAEAMADVYREVFDTYPFPIHDPDYLVETMRSHVRYFCIETGGKLVALSSAEMDEENRNAEMTDFATLPEYRGHSFATHLLEFMEEFMRTDGILTAYTIARARSAGMNITFARQGYEYGGRLVNNTNICGHIESMNVWHKPLH